jgi:hypothetical protein
MTVIRYLLLCDYVLSLIDVSLGHSTIVACVRMRLIAPEAVSPFAVLLNRLPNAALRCGIACDTYPLAWRVVCLLTARLVQRRPFCPAIHNSTYGGTHHCRVLQQPEHELDECMQ